MKNEEKNIAKRRLYIIDFCLTPQKYIPHAGILCEGNYILAIGGASAFAHEEGLEVIELQGVYALPGFIDTHIHGAGGFDSTTADNPESDIEMMCKTLASHGVTSFVPSIISGPTEKMLSTISALVGMLGKKHEGAEPIGIHVEGPFLNKRKHGSQYQKDIRKIDLGEALELITAGKKLIKTMTFAPELKDSVKLIELLLENNIIPSMGHSLADEPAVLKAVDAGAIRCTHIYNGMPPLHQRAVGLTAVALTDDRIHVEIILDGFHLHPRMVDLVCRSKPKDKLIGISDAIEGTGLRDGTYHLGRTALIVKKGRSTTTQGTLAGTTLTLERGWRHLITFSHMDKRDAAACFTINPARSLSLNDRGELHPGKRADIAFFDSKTNNAKLSVCEGRIIFDSTGKLHSSG